jgi:hypothetical protein
MTTEQYHEYLFNIFDQASEDRQRFFYPHLFSPSSNLRWLECSDITSQYIATIKDSELPVSREEFEKWSDKDKKNFAAHHNKKRIERNRLNRIKGI